MISVGRSRHKEMVAINEDKLYQFYLLVESLNCEQLFQLAATKKPLLR